MNKLIVTFSSVELDKDWKGHFMPRVSEILDFFQEPYLVAWKLKNRDWQKVSEEALRIGTIVDQMVQVDIRCGQYVYPDDPTVSNCVKAWEKFKQERPDVLERLFKYQENIQRELVLGDLVGHPDFILDDEVIDLKTSKSVSKSHWMQTAQYAHMVSSTTMIVHSKQVKLPTNIVPGSVITVNNIEDIFATSQKIKKISILRLDKLTGEYEYRTLEEPFLTFWQRKFQARLECYMEEKEFREMMRVKLEQEKLA